MWRGRKTWGGSPLLQNVLLPPPHILFKHIDIRQSLMHEAFRRIGGIEDDDALGVVGGPELEPFPCLLYTSDAADE